MDEPETNMEEPSSGFRRIERRIARPGGHGCRATAARQANLGASIGKPSEALWHLTVEFRGLRETLIGPPLMAAFRLFWSVLALLLAGAPFYFGPHAGLFGAISAAGVVAAP